MADFPPPGGFGGQPATGPGPGWWQASDGNWYPPEQQPGYGAPATPYGYGYAAPASMTTNGMAIASLVLSLLSLACGITWILGIIFGHVALGQIKRTGEGGKGLAVAGLVVGYLCFAAFVGFILLIIFAANDVDSSGGFDFEGLLR
jgi:hypothetical protein